MFLFNMWQPVVSIEHASNAIPPELGTLGLTPEILESHVAWDAGAEYVGQKLAAAIQSPIVVGEYSRLVADLNRSPENHESVPSTAFGVAVPGNSQLSDKDRKKRLETYHSPYWSEVLKHIHSIFDSGHECLHLGIHSFTHEYPGQVREMDIGLLVDPSHIGDGPITKLIHKAINESGLDCRVNEPYSGLNDGITTNFRNRFLDGRYASVEFEVSHRLLGDLDRVAKIIIEAVQTSGYLDEYLKQ